MGNATPVLPLLLSTGMTWHDLVWPVVAGVPWCDLNHPMVLYDDLGGPRHRPLPGCAASFPTPADLLSTRRAWQ